MKRVVLLSGFLAVAGFLAASPAGALSISAVGIISGVSNTADNGAPGGSDSNNTSAVSVLGSGGTTPDVVAATMSAQTRYASNLWADAGTFGTAINSITNNSYDMSLTISADAGTTYDIAIETLFKGILVRVDDDYFGKSSAGVGAVEVTLNSVVSAPHATSAQMLALGFYDASLAFSESGSSSLIGQTGTTVLNFSVSWESNADNLLDDEAAVLLGLDEAGGSVFGVSAGEYGSLSTTRDLNDDGHFITVQATVTSVTAVPEPGTGVLLAMGLAGIVVQRRRSQA